jgi:hypothetical protein
MASVFLNPNAKFSFLSYSDTNLAKNLKTEPLLKSIKLNGEFKAKENHLGIVLLSLKEPKGVDFENEDTLMFRIKEKGSNVWYQENTYKSGLFYGYPLFPFGFPIIDNSKNKTYIFQLESLYGTKDNAVSVNKDMPVFMSSYKIPFKEVFFSSKNLTQFVIKKIVTSFSNFDFILYSTLYLIPLLYYILWLITTKKIKFSGSFLMPISITIILIDIFMIKESYAGIIFLAAGTWIVFIIMSNFKTNISFIFSFICITLGVIMISINPNIVIAKLAAWGFYMLAIGILQEIWLLRTFKNHNADKHLNKK